MFIVDTLLWLSQCRAVKSAPCRVVSIPTEQERDLIKECNGYLKQMKMKIDVILTINFQGGNHDKPSTDSPNG